MSTIFWYYSNGSEQIGPVDDAEFRRLLGQNVIRPETLIWREGMKGWQQRQAVITVTAPAGSVLCEACGCVVPDGESFVLSGRPFCAACKPGIMQRIQEGKGLPATGAEELRQAHIKHEASVKSIGLLYFLGSVTLGFVGVLMFSDVLSGKSRPGQEFWGVFFFALAVLQFVAAVGLRQLRPWSRVIAGIVSGIGLLGFPLGTVFNAYILYLLFSRKGAMLFTPEYRAAIAVTPHVRYRTSPWVWAFLVVLILVIFGIVVAASSRR